MLRHNRDEVWLHEFSHPKRAPTSPRHRGGRLRPGRAFYRDALGLGELESFQGEDDARVMILNAGIATLEISNPAQVRLIDRVEAEGQPSAQLRVAFEVDDSQQATDTLVAPGARLIASPRETPWRSLNSRLEAPAGVQVTLFEELDGRPHDGVV